MSTGGKGRGEEGQVFDLFKRTYFMDGASWPYKIQVDGMV